MEIAIAVLSLIVSLFTFWVTYGHRGKIKMTRPTIVVFAFEGMRKDEPKVFLRTLLRSTSKQGEVVESLYLKLANNGSTQTFSVWAYGDNGIVRGSGIYVGEQGVEVYHHFIVPKSVKDFKFLPGRYDIEIYAVIRDKKVKLYELQVELPAEMINILSNGVLGIYFDWDPELNNYTANIQSPNAEQMSRLLT